MSQPNNFVKYLTPFLLAMALAACGGGGSSSFGSKKDGGDKSDGEDGEEEVTLNYTLGQMSIGLNNLAAGGSTGITLDIRDQNNKLSNVEQSVSYSSECISNGISTITTPTKSTNGVFTTTYTSIGCEGNDEITATFGSQSVRGTVTVQAANLGAVEFVSAEPQNILLKGMSAAGKQHTSTVKFLIKNDVGGPIPDADVTFSLSTVVGGITLSSTTSKTDNQGFVSTILQAGSVHTPVRVRASVTRGGITISSESSQLVISTGVADQNSLSLSLSNFNPSGWNYDGEKVTATVYASDRYNSPVPDGTTVSFYTELGQIQPSCQTVSGSCNVEWTSSLPRDLGIPDVRYPRDNATNNPDGISTITAVVIGEESFVDVNSNGIFDDGDLLDNISDRGEAFEDYNKDYDIDANGSANNSFDNGLEPYIDFNNNATYDAKDGSYTGLGCAHSTLCAAGNGLKNIFASAELVMAEDNLNFTIWDDSSLTIPAVNNAIYNDHTYYVEVFGASNHQVPPSKTTVAASSSEATIVIGSVEVPSTNQHRLQLTTPRGAFVMPLRVKDTDITEIVHGSITITIEPPKGNTLISIFSYIDGPHPP